MLFAKLNTSNMVVDFDFKRFVFKYFWVPGMFGILVLNFTSCAENYDPATRLLPCYFHPLVKIPQKFIVLELGVLGQKGKRGKSCVILSGGIIVT